MRAHETRMYDVVATIAGLPGRNRDNLKGLQITLYASPEFAAAAQTEMRGDSRPETDKNLVGPNADVVRTLLDDVIMEGASRPLAPPVKH